MEKIDLETYKHAALHLYNKLRLLTYPIGIKYITDESQFPEKIFRPSKIGKRMTLCQAFTTARRHGTVVGMGFKDNVCITSSFIHGWEEMHGKHLLQSQVISGYHKNVEAELKVGQQVYQEYSNAAAQKIVGGHKGFIVFPLQKARVMPDVVLIYGDPAQMMHLCHALAYEGKYIVTSNFAGYAESCLKGGLLPMIKNKPQLVLCGTGDRMIALTKEEEMAMGIPGHLLPYINENLLKAGGPTNMGQPVRFISGELPISPPAWTYLEEEYKKLKKIELQD